MEYGEAYVIKRGTKQMLMFSVKNWAMLNSVTSCANMVINNTTISSHRASGLSQLILWCWLWPHIVLKCFMWWLGNKLCNVL